MITDLAAGQSYSNAAGPAVLRPADSAVIRNPAPQLLTTPTLHLTSRIVSSDYYRCQLGIQILTNVLQSPLQQSAAQSGSRPGC